MNYSLDDVVRILYNSDTFTLQSYLNDKKFCKVICDNDLFYKNLDLIIKNNKLYMNVIIDKIMNYNEKYILDSAIKLVEYYINNRIGSECVFLIRKIGLDVIINYLKDNNIVLEDIRLIRFLLNTYKDNKLIIDNIDYFINNSTALLDLKEIFKQYNIKNGVEKINEILDNDISRVVLDAVYPRTGLTIKKLEDEKIYDTVRIMIEELCKEESIQYHEIRHLSIGGYSNVLIIGSKVLKLGKERKNFKIKNNKRFLAGFRGEIKSLNNDSVVLTYEITEEVDVKHNNTISLYDLYKELRDQGLIWIDCHKDNVGILLRDNKVYFNGFDKININATGYTTENNETLKKGDTVIIDNDYIFTEDEFQKLFDNKKSLLNNIYSLGSIADYEFQYQMEKKKCEKGK